MKRPEAQKSAVGVLVEHMPSQDFYGIFKVFHRLHKKITVL
jgi:hypothetical protein